MAETTEATTERGVDDLIALFDTLVPPDSEIVVEDIAGNRYTLPGAISARRQIRVLREMEKLKDAAIGGEEADKLAAMFDGKLTGGALMREAFGGIVRLASQDAILSAIESAFGAAHPKIVKQAIEAVADDDARGAADVFAIEEMLGGLLPFFVRLLKRGARAMGSLGALRADPEDAPKVLVSPTPTEQAEATE